MLEFNTRDLSRDLFHHLTHSKETQTKKKKKAAVSKCISSRVFSACGFK